MEVYLLSFIPAILSDITTIQVVISEINVNNVNVM